MQAIPDDYQPEERKAFPDGKYKAKGIKWFTLDDRQNPILVFQKGDGRMVARCRFDIEGHNDGPPMSMELSQVPMLVKAFNADITKLPVMPSADSPGLVSQYLVTAQNLINESGKILVVDVSNGWVDQSGVSGMEVTGYIYFKFAGVQPNAKTGRIEPITGNYGPFFFTKWKVLAGEGGSVSPFAGATFTEMSNYAVSVEEGVPVWSKTDSGGWSFPAVMLARMMMSTAPDMFVDTYTAKDPYNLLPEWNEMALKKGQVLKGNRGKSERGRIRMDWGQVDTVYNFVEPGASSGTVDTPAVVTQGPVSQAPKLDHEAIDAKSRLLIKNVLSELADGEAFVSGTFDLTTEGKVTAKKYLGPLKDAGVVSHGIIKNLSWDEVKAILDNIVVSEEFKEKLQSFKHELAVIGIGADEDGSADF